MTQSMAHRRDLVYIAEGILKSFAVRVTHRVTYNRGAPAVKLTNNVFYFSRKEDVPRAVLWNYCVFFDAPDLPVSKYVKEYPESERKRLKRGRLNRFINIDSDDALRALKSACADLKRRVK